MSEGPHFYKRSMLSPRTMVTSRFRLLLKAISGSVALLQLVPVLMLGVPATTEGTAEDVNLG